MAASNRRVIREAVVRTVFECEFRKVQEDWLCIFEEKIAEFELVSYEKKFAEALLEATFNNLSENKEWVERIAPEWPFSKVAKLDQAVLLTGLAELKFLKELEIPPKATLNEFVEIAKNYSDDSSRRFVNGVLSSAQKELESQT